MKKKTIFVQLLFVYTLVSTGYGQRTLGGSSLILDNNAGKQITLMPPVGLPNSYTWVLPLFPPPPNSAFSEAGTLTGQMLRWDNNLGYWTATSAVFAAGNAPGSFIGIGTTTPGRLLDVAGVSGTPNVRIQSLSGTTNWGQAVTNTDGLVFSNISGDLLKRDPMTVLNQFSWLIGGNTNPSSTVLGTNTSQALDIRTNATSRMLFASSGNILLGNAGVPSTLTIEPGIGGNVVINNVSPDNTTSLFLTVDGSNRVRTRTLSSILSVTANEGLVYDSPNIKLGATDGATNPLAAHRFVNLNNMSLNFTHSGGASSLLMLHGSTGNVGIGVASPNNFKLQVAGHIGPNANNTYDLGSNSLRWRDVFIGPSSLHIGNGSGDQTTLSYTNTSGVKKFNINADDDGDVDMNVDGVGNLEFTGALEPNNSSGTSGQYLKSSGANTPPTWANITTSAWGITGNSGTSSTSNFVGTTDNTNLVFRTNNIPRAYFRNSTPLEVTGDDSGAFVPNVDAVYSLGTYSNRWKDIYLSNSSIKMGGFINGNKNEQNEMAFDEVTISYQNGTLVIDKPLGSTGSMVPNNTDLFTLGTSTNRWKDLYLGPSSLHIGDDTLEARISYEPSVAELRFNTNGVGPTEVTMYGNGNVAIANLAAGGLLKAAAGTGILSVASGGSDFEAPLTFNNGLTRTLNTIKLGGALTASTDVPLAGFNMTLSGLGRFGIGTLSPANKFAVGASSQFQVDSSGTIASATGITSSGNINFTGLGSGIVKSTGGTLGIATAGTEYEPTLTFNNGLTRTANTIKLGGALTAATDIPLGGFNLTFSGTGNVGIGDATPASPLTVGSGDLFQVDAAGDVVKLKNVTYSWPGANAAGVLTNNGTGTLSWAALSAITSLNGQTGVTQTFATSTTGTDFTVSSASNVHTFNLPNASATARGVLTTGAQTVAGAKAFSGAATFASGLTVENQNGVILNELTSNGTDGVTLRASASLSAPYTLTLPTDDGTANQVLTTDGSGVLSWTTPGGGGTPAGANTQIQYNNAGAFGASTNLTYNGTTFIVASTGKADSVTTSSTTDGEFAIRGTATGTSTNQIIGVWGDASTDAAGNTGTIGILATGSGRTTTAETNIALQISDGELTMGRTSQAPSVGSVVEAANSGTGYTQEGPSGVFEIAYQDAGNGDLVLASSQFVNWCANIQVNNRYVTANSIILVEVLSQIEGTTSQGTPTFSNANLTFTSSVKSRAAGNFKLTIDVFNTTGANVRLDGTATPLPTDFDKIRVGYVVINPSR